ncbi:Crp/Fnr family transcriptional regulator [Sphingomonas sp. BIUV-7]|uniref:Crp/Fnr family transcriptional regulator n=1 Tax=Sphingomonas natans TaxID=3063330 RepID=A0ABT8Y398_9SPHN|nr:Crp/Fnr family transcriptional regulator [Sphingomonas sp. BIUV-7]MDO6412780.1 Crp/Fnr family transcriptional regulator [Sphingomonas sp. BIUV-7]
MTDDPKLDAIGSLIARLRRSDMISENEVAALAGLISVCRDYPARAVVARPREHLEKSQLLVEGFVARQTELPNGRRQILAIHVPGDFLDLHGLLLKSLDHDVVTLSPARLAEAPHAILRETTAQYPHVARLLWFSTMVDAAIHREWIASLGRTAAGRIAHLFCELQLRLEVVGRADADGYALPLTQIDIADATALTPVHVNRTLRHLREAGIVDFRTGHVAIGDLPALRRIAGFRPDYLYLEQQPR